MGEGNSGIFIMGDDGRMMPLGCVSDVQLGAEQPEAYETYQSMEGWSGTFCVKYKKRMYAVILGFLSRAEAQFQRKKMRKYRRMMKRLKRISR